MIDDLERLAHLVAGGELEEADALASLPRSSRPVFLERLRSLVAESESAGTRGASAAVRGER